MSLGFRIFLLILLSFLVLWGYHVRSPGLERWLSPAFSARPPQAPRFVSPVKEFLDPKMRLNLSTLGPLVSALPPQRPPAVVFDPEAGGLTRAVAAEPPAAEEFYDVRVYEAYENEAYEAYEVYEVYEVYEDEVYEVYENEVYENEVYEDEAYEHYEDYVSGSQGEVDAVHAGAGDVSEMVGAREEDFGDAASRGDGAPGQDYVVSTGDSLWTIARRFLGAGSRWEEIVAANPEYFARRGQQVRVGERLRIPGVTAGQVGAAEESLKPLGEPVDIPVEEGSTTTLAPSEGDAAAGEDPASGAPITPPGGTVLHIVDRNENLTKIARLYYPGDALAWKRIFAANLSELKSPDHLEPGTLLKIPLGP